MQVIHEAEQVRLLAKTEFLMVNASALQTKLLAALEEVNESRVILDLRDTKVMDSIGVKLVIGLLKTCQKKGITLRVEVASPTIIRLFQICKLNHVLDLREVAVNG